MKGQWDNKTTFYGLLCCVNHVTQEVVVYKFIHFEKERDNVTNLLQHLSSLLLNYLA